MGVNKMDYGFSERRKTRTDKKAKSRYNRYKKGGAFRTREDKQKKEEC